ncbi:hypothetical protein GGR56DRAFT_670698 [Xylariaceae sp. FL0804]|nr:hypothetical protein GGR56DRAFT_670698 [Xylariaceae sp. FL0804]
MPKDLAPFTKSKPKGVVNFPPIENLDDQSRREVERFKVYPLGKIQDFCRHIPYNSGKKDFYEKTGRESFEVFHYVFKVPGDDTEYAVMWDYNNGLVRMTPFFKCCKYPKTTPAKMLNANPGLKEITHSITGGAIMAQGYWMPYECAKAVCATFCHHVAGALIPLFGPDFPSLCTPAEAPEHTRMIIDPATVMESTREADHFRRIYLAASKTAHGRGGGGGGGSPKRDRHLLRDPYGDDGRPHPRHRIRTTYIATGCDTPYATDTEGEISPAATDYSGAGREHHPHHYHHHQQHPHQQQYPHQPSHYPYSPLPSAPLQHPGSGWTPANAGISSPSQHAQAQQAQAHPHSHPHHHPQQQHGHYEQQPPPPGPSPWLSAIPRFTTTAHLPPPPSSIPPPPPHAHVCLQALPAPARLPYAYPHPHPTQQQQQQHQQLPPPPPWRAKRPAEHVDPGYGYGYEEDERDLERERERESVVRGGGDQGRAYWEMADDNSNSSSPRDDDDDNRHNNSRIGGRRWEGQSSGEDRRHQSGGSSGRGSGSSGDRASASGNGRSNNVSSSNTGFAGPDKNAALLLMNLRVGDPRARDRDGSDDMERDRATAAAAAREQQQEQEREREKDAADKRGGAAAPGRDRDRDRDRLRLGARQWRSDRATTASSRRDAELPRVKRVRSNSM